MRSPWSDNKFDFVSDVVLWGSLTEQCVRVAEPWDFRKSHKHRQPGSPFSNGSNTDHWVQRVTHSPNKCLTVIGTKGLVSLVND